MRVETPGTSTCLGGLRLCEQRRELYLTPFANSRPGRMGGWHDRHRALKSNAIPHNGDVDITSDELLGYEGDPLLLVMGLGTSRVW